MKWFFECFDFYSKACITLCKSIVMDVASLWNKSKINEIAVTINCNVMKILKCLLHLV